MSSLKRNILSQEADSQPNQDTDFMNSSREDLPLQYPSRSLNTMHRTTSHEQSIKYCDLRQNMLIKLRRLLIRLQSDFEQPANNTDDLIFKIDSSGRNLIDLMLEPVTSYFDKSFTQPVKFPKKEAK